LSVERAGNLCRQTFRRPAMHEVTKALIWVAVIAGGIYVANKLGVIS
jgi:hypothetical protein